LLGGSLFQVIIPITTAIVFARSSLQSLPFTLYWTGQSIVNVSIYIGERALSEIASHFSSCNTDWHWLLNNTGTMEYAKDIAMIVNITGLLTCCIGICVGFYFITHDSIRMFSPE